MPNILNNPDYWFGGSTDANGNFTLQVHGSYSTESNKTLEWSGNGDPPTPYEIKAQVVCNISNYDAYQWNSLYFYVYSYQLQGLIHLETILEAGSAPSNDYTFDLDVTADNISQGIVMGVTDAPNYAWGAPPGPYGYEQIGQIQIIPVADPVEPSEPVEQPMITAKVSVLVTRKLPWWMCLPKKPVTPCPVRPTGFVPFSEYDSEFKFPLASSRKPSRIKRDADCIACRPVVGDEPVEPTPDPVDPPVPPEPEIQEITICGYGTEGGPAVFMNSTLNAEESPLPFVVVTQYGDTGAYVYSEHNPYWEQTYGNSSNSVYFSDGDVVDIYQGTKHYKATYQEGGVAGTWGSHYEVQGLLDPWTRTEVIFSVDNTTQSYFLAPNTSGNFNEFYWENSQEPPSELLSQGSAVPVQFKQENDGGFSEYCGVIYRYVGT